MNNFALNSLPLKKRINVFDGPQLEQEFYAQDEFFYARPAPKFQIRDASSQTDEEYFRDINELYAELKILRKQVKLTGFETDRTPSASTGSGEEEAQNITQSERGSTSSSEAPRVCHKRKAKSNKSFCNYSKKVSLFMLLSFMLLSPYGSNLI